MIRLTIIAIAALTMTCQASVFDFESVPAGTTTPFSITEDGITASFSSPGTNDFFVTPGFFSTLTGNTLLVADPGPDALFINLSQPVTDLSLRFALNAPPSAEIMVQAMLGSDVIGSASATGTIPPMFIFPEGVLTFSAGQFDSLTISSAANDFAVDDIAVTTSAIPEPGSLLLTAFGLAGVLALASRSCQVAAKR